MGSVHSSVFDRSDTLLGVCEALGQDFGFNPLWLRIAFAVPLIWNPVAVFSAYLALGAVVLLSRLLFPNRRRAAPVEAEQPAEPQVEEFVPELAVAA